MGGTIVSQGAVNDPNAAAPTKWWCERMEGDDDSAQLIEATSREEALELANKEAGVHGMPYIFARLYDPTPRKTGPAWAILKAQEAAAKEDAEKATTEA